MVRILEGYRGDGKLIIRPCVNTGYSLPKREPTSRHPDRDTELAPWIVSHIPELRPAMVRRIGKDIGGELPAGKLLLLCCGHNGLPNSLHSCFAKEGVISDGFCHV